MQNSSILLPFVPSDYNNDQLFNDTILENASEPLDASADQSIKEMDLLLADSRFIVQRVLTPIIFVIGVVGNGITVLVLTRRHMQSSTNCYLTALAVSDFLFLFFVFSLSLKYIPGMEHNIHWFYWHYFRFALWLADASNGTSIWLTVMFTIERYIAVSYPMKGKVFCTESRAKKIIVGVYIACFALTVSTPYEWVVEPNPKDNGTSLILAGSPLGNHSLYRKTFYWFSAVSFILVPLLLLVIFNSFLIAAVKESRNIRRQMTQKQPIKESHSQQENKITVMLISVVLFALVCQMPTACMLIYTSFKQIEPNSMEFYVTRILNNIFNLLTTINAASNFILYCAMSDRFRKTFLKTFCYKWYIEQMNNQLSMYGASTDGMTLQTSFRASNSTRCSWNSSTKVPVQETRLEVPSASPGSNTHLRVP